MNYVFDFQAFADASITNVSSSIRSFINANPDIIVESINIVESTTGTQWRGQLYFWRVS